MHENWRKRESERAFTRTAAFHFLFLIVVVVRFFFCYIGYGGAACTEQLIAFYLHKNPLKNHKLGQTVHKNKYDNENLIWKTDFVCIWGIRHHIRERNHTNNCPQKFWNYTFVSFVVNAYCVQHLKFNIKWP